MTFEQSIEVLGLSERAREKGPITQAELRAAYVALIKVHKPERDPEGFKRVREAYEAAQQGLFWHEQAFGLGAQPEGASASNGQDVRPAASPAEAKEAAPTRDEAALAVEDAIDAAYQQIDAANDDAARIALLRQAIGRFPQEHAFRWQLIDAYDAAEKRDLADEVLAEGVALDLPAFLETYAREAPERITGAQLEKLRARKATRVVLRVAIAQGRDPLFREALQSAMEEGPHKQPRMPYIDLALFALEREDVTSASRMLAALKEHDAHFAIEPRAQVAELLTRDVLRLRDGLPHTYLRALIRGIRLGHANPEVTSLRTKDPELAREVLDLLREHSAPLSKLYEPLLVSSAPQPAPTKISWHWGWVVLASIVIRALMATTRHTEGASSYALQRALDARIEERQRQLPEDDARAHEAELAERLLSRPPHADVLESEASPSTSLDATAPTSEQVHDAVRVICQEAVAHCAAAERLERDARRGHCDLMAVTEFSQDTYGLSPAQELATVRQAALAPCVLDTARP